MRVRVRGIVDRRDDPMPAVGGQRPIIPDGVASPAMLMLHGTSSIVSDRLRVSLHGTSGAVATMTTNRREILVSMASSDSPLEDPVTIL